LPQVASPGARLLLDDGAIALAVENTTDTDVNCRIINGGVLGERKGINLPGIPLPIDSLTEKDIADLHWAVEQKADYIALSFVRTAEDCVHAKEMIKKAGGRAPLVAKIEKAEAIDHLDEIIAATDAVMVARGDLGVETSVELVPVYQKRIIEKSVSAGKMVITATQMLQSMVTNPRPTRAEASDVANAVWDGTDAVMLSNETATGIYPVQAVATMARIIETAESGRTRKDDNVSKWAGRQSGRVSRALCEAAAFAAEEMGTRLTAVFTESGLMARRLSALRPDQRIVALTSTAEVQNELALIWGVDTLITPPASSTEEMLRSGEETLLAAGAAEKGEMIVVMAGRLSGLGLSSSVTILTLGGKLGPTSA
jgi:pyruvate kinase